MHWEQERVIAVHAGLDKVRGQDALPAQAVSLLQLCAVLGMLGDYLPDTDLEGR